MRIHRLCTLVMILCLAFVLTGAPGALAAAPAAADIAPGAQPSTPPPEGAAAASSAGIAHGDPGTSVSVQSAVLYDNGPLVTHPGGGYNGNDASSLQTALSLSTYGFGAQADLNYRVADDFTVLSASGWSVDSITFFAYQSGSYDYPPTSTITALYYQVWNGPPDSPTSTVVYGDLVTDRLQSAAWSGIYRVLDTALTNTQRPIIAVTAGAGFYLPPGTYWLEWMMDGSLTSGPWVPPISILGQTTTGNALQYTNAWAPVIDSGTGTQQGLPFLIFGAAEARLYIPLCLK